VIVLLSAVWVLLYVSDLEFDNTFLRTISLEQREIVSDNKTSVTGKTTGNGFKEYQ